jgi:lipid-A-disaccharide synthase-like uncharacterized protein
VSNTAFVDTNDMPQKLIDIVAYNEAAIFVLTGIMGVVSFRKRVFVSWYARSGERYGDCGGI